MNKDFADELSQALSPLGITLTEDETENFHRYKKLIDEWNEKINLISENSAGDMLSRHFADSLSPMAYMDDWKDTCACAAAIDMGSGAGFPGIPLKIMNPGMQMTLLDSLKKRIRFLNDVIMEIPLSDTATLEGRAEDLGQNEVFREKYDLCVSRAVANLATLSEYCLPFVKIGGKFIAYKSEDVMEEMQAATEAIELLGGELRDVLEYDIPSGRHSLIVIEKVRPTPKKYPRRAGKPGKDPLT